MTKPDFEKMAKRALDQWDINRIYSAVVDEITSAYAAGRADERERCVGVAQMEQWKDNTPIAVGDACYRIADAIRRGGEE